MAEIFPAQKFPELFFGCVAPIGTDIDLPIRKLTRKLEGFGYKVIQIRVTDVFPALNQTLKLDLKSSPLEARFDTYIAFGDRLRERFSDDSFLAYTCMQQVIFARAALAKDVPEKVAYVLRQFKRKEEIDLLRSVYGRLFFQISIHSKRSKRVDN